MPKLYYPTPDELQGATPLNENLWMREYQGLMLALANTNEGKDLLCIEDHGLPVIGMRKNAVLYDQGDQLMADFRVGAKWGNVVRYRWQEVRRALDRMNELFLLKAIQSGVPAGAATLTQYPDPNHETNSFDGTIGRQVSSETFFTIRTSTGNSLDDSAETITAARFNTSTTQDEYEGFSRGLYGFYTSALGAGATVSAAVLSLYGSSGNEQIGGDDAVLVGNPTPASNTGATNADYLLANIGNTEIGAARIDIGTLAGTSYHDFTLTSTGRGFISLTGTTWEATRIGMDFDNSPPTWQSNKVDNATVVAAETTGESKDPKLVITYTLAFTPKAIMF